MSEAVLSRVVMRLVRSIAASSQRVSCHGVASTAPRAKHILLHAAIASWNLLSTLAAASEGASLAFCASFVDASTAGMNSARSAMVSLWVRVGQVGCRAQPRAQRFSGHLSQ